MKKKRLKCSLELGRGSKVAASALSWLHQQYQQQQQAKNMSVLLDRVVSEERASQAQIEGLPAVATV